MSQEETRNSKGKYYSVIDGTFRVQVPETHPDAVRREWSTPDGKSGVKYEREVQALFGTITDIQFNEGEYGKNINIVLDETEDGETPIISLSTSSRYGESFLKLLPAIDVEKEVRIQPYSFIPEGKEKEVRGISVAHRDENGNFTVKVQNHFFDQETKTALHGYPTPEIAEGESWDADEWKGFYAKARKFMEKYATENVLPKFKQEEKGFEYPAGDEVNPEDIPFD